MHLRSTVMTLCRTRVKSYVKAKNLEFSYGITVAPRTLCRQLRNGPMQETKRTSSSSNPESLEKGRRSKNE